MKTKLLTIALLVAMFIVARKGLDTTWSIARTEFPTGYGPVIILHREGSETVSIPISPDERVTLVSHHGRVFEVISTADLGVAKLALVQAHHYRKSGAPTWFVQIPYKKWRPL
jgi:hypothetical protein